MNDPELQQLIRQENDHYLGVIDLIAASNAPSAFVRNNSEWGVAQFRSAEGLVGRRPYAGTHNFDAIELLAIQRGCALFRAEYCNVQPLSGSMANLAVYKALLQPGDVILSMAMGCGGHLTHGHYNHLVSELYRVAHYEVNRQSLLLDYDAIRARALEVSPKLIIAGYSSYPRVVDFARFKEIGNEVGAYVLADISHIAGLVAAGLHPNPCDHQLIVTSSIEKTLRGTRGGFILCPETLAQKIDRGVFPGLQSSIGLASLVTMANLFHEATTHVFQDYQRALVSHARLMSQIFVERGLSVITGGTDTHLVLLNVKHKGLTGREAEQRLEKIGILSNRNMIPFDPLPPFQASGLRLGTPTVTARGYEADEVALLAQWIVDAILSPNWSDSVAEDYRMRVAQMALRLREKDTLRDLITGSA